MMTPERREAIVEAIIAEEKDRYMDMMGGDVGMAEVDFESEVTEERISAFDKWLRSFPA